MMIRVVESVMLSLIITINGAHQHKFRYKYHGRRDTCDQIDRDGEGYDRVEGPPLHGQVDSR
jgi:hypothetical protein